MFKIKRTAVYQYLLQYKEKSGQKVLTFLFFVLLSTVFWLFSSLNENYSGKVSYPIKYKNLPADKILIGDIPEKIQLEIYGTGYTILRYKLRPKSPISFNIASFSVNKQTGKHLSSFYIITESAKEKVQDQLGNDIKVTGILPDTLYFNFSSLIEKRLVVKPNIQTVFEKQYMQKGDIITVPEHIVASGPKKILDTLNFAETQFHKFLLIKDTVKRMLKLTPINMVSFTPEEVELIINAEKYTESEIKIPITTKNVPDSVIMNTFPRNVLITFRVALSDYEKAVPALFEITADYLEIDKETNQISLKLAKAPDFVSAVKLKIQRVEYLIER